MNQPTLPPATLHSRLHNLPDWQFTGALYLFRWFIVAPIAFLLSPFVASADTFQAEGSPWRYLIPFVIVAPAIETFIECSIPYWAVERVFNGQRRSPWPFVVVSAILMVLLHPLTPIVITFTLITGTFLAYVYAHFAPQSHRKAFAHTMAFHAAINMVGWIGILIQSLT